MAGAENRPQLRSGRLGGAGVGTPSRALEHAHSFSRTRAHPQKAEPLVSHAELPPSARTPITRTPWARRLHDKQEPAIDFRTCSRSSRRAERPICRASSSLGLLLSERRERRAECRWMKSWERATCSSRPRDGTAVRCDAYSRALKRVGPWGDVVVEETRKRTRRTGV
jgi:hypothetical protein